MMSFALGINLALVMLCALVLLQSARMMRRIRELKADDLHGTVQALDHAAGQARQVLEEMRSLLTGDMAGAFRTVRTAQALQEELTILIGIGNALADRIIDASASVAPHPSRNVAPDASDDADADTTGDAADTDTDTAGQDVDDLHHPAPSSIA